jgi:predicted RNase H-like HicB family nuclease
MKYRFTTVITEENNGFVARALELGVVSQGKTVEQAETNLKEAVSLFLEKENVIDINNKDRSPIVTSLEVEYA